jgi:hypothetical protein
MLKYKIQIDVTTDRTLSDEQIKCLESAIRLQVDEPQDYDGNDETWSAVEVNIGTYRL